MTESEHADLSRRLALALGYAPESVLVLGENNTVVLVYRLGIVAHRGQWLNTKRETWLPFDYRSGDVALPVLEWLRKGWNGTVGTDARTGNPYVFLWKLHDDGYEPLSRYRHEADTLPEAIARAAIAVKGIA